jgi:hypothetical protein
VIHPITLPLATSGVAIQPWTTDASPQFLKRESFWASSKMTGRPVRLMLPKDQELAQLTIKPDTASVRYHWHNPQNTIYAALASDGGLCWDLLDWAENL